MNLDGLIARLKDHLVAKCYAQTYGIDYSKTFLPVANISSIRFFISLAATYEWALHQLDVKNSFLRRDLEEEVYMELPPGFVAQGEYGRVCKLKKALYGLKQSSRAWFGKFSKAVIEFGLRRSIYDHSVFYSSSNACCILLVVYVDDIVITGSDKAEIKKLKSFIGTCFQTKDLGSLKYFLGIKVSRSSKSICLSQRKYCLDLLDDAGQIEAKSYDEPMIPKLKLRSEDGRLLHNPEKYRRVVGKLNYLTITHPDIAFPVSVVSQVLTAPRTSHWDDVTQILGYLKGTPGLGILYVNHGHHIAEGFTDSDYAGCLNTLRFTMGYCVFVGGNLVSWKSKKQNVVSRSSSEAEYRAIAQTTCELVWLRNLLGEIGFP
ncbi:retrovirus-related pol polyprotein from transposon TNT 1-94 [Tanacetum coccineum]